MKLQTIAMSTERLREGISIGLALFVYYGIVLIAVIGLGVLSCFTWMTTPYTWARLKLKKDT